MVSLHRILCGPTSVGCHSSRYDDGGTSYFRWLQVRILNLLHDRLIALFTHSLIQVAIFMQWILMLLHLYLWSILCRGIFFSYLEYFQSLRQVRGVLNRCSHCSGCHLPFLVFIRYQDINSWAATVAHWECYLWFLYGHNTISSRRSYCWYQDDCRGASIYPLPHTFSHSLAQ